MHVPRRQPFQCRHLGPLSLHLPNDLSPVPGSIHTATHPPTTMPGEFRPIDLFYSPLLPPPTMPPHHHTQNRSRLVASVRKAIERARRRVFRNHEPSPAPHGMEKLIAGRVGRSPSCDLDGWPGSRRTRHLDDRATSRVEAATTIALIRLIACASRPGRLPSTPSPIADAAGSDPR